MWLGDLERRSIETNEDAYGLILSTQSYFRATKKSEVAKMMVTILGG